MDTILDYHLSLHTKKFIIYLSEAFIMQTVLGI